MAGNELQLDHIVSDIARIVKITFWTSDVVNMIIVDFERFDGTEKNYTLGRQLDSWNQIVFHQDEYITRVRICVGTYDKRKCLKSIQITTNQCVYGPYGKYYEDDEPETYHEFNADGDQIIGFYGRIGEFIHAIGVYVKKRDTQTDVEAPAIENKVSNFNFSDGLYSWKINFGPCVAGVVSDESNYINGVRPKLGNSYAIVTNRTAEQQGLMQDITDKITSRTKYAFSAYVRTVDKISRKNVALATLELRNGRDNSPQYVEIGGALLSAKGWVKLEGSFILPSIAESVNFYIEGPPAGIDLLIDSVKITKAGEPLEQDYHKVHKVLIENKALKEMIKEYEMFCNSNYIMVKFIWFKPSELPDTYLEKDRLGEGGFGNVYKAVINGMTVAIKFPKQGWQGAREFNQEVEILGRIRHPNLVTLIGACRERYTLVYEFLSKGSLEDRLKNNKTLTWKERVKIASSICRALLLLHNTKPNPIAHGDLKPNNVLFDANNVCKISDFGISRFLKYTYDTKSPNHETKEPMGTSFYIDPEFMSSGKLTTQSDIYAFGIILLRLVTGKGPNEIRNFVFEALHTTMDDINLETFKKRTPRQKEKILEKFLDSDLADWSTDEVVKMTSLGLRCSSYERKNRPDLETIVWTEIQSMNGF